VVQQFLSWTDQAWGGGGMGLHVVPFASDVSQLVQVLWDEILTSIVLVARL
jgi:hypothetical protein